jgi:hypothetical protein
MENIVVFTTLKEELQKHLAQYGLSNVFYLLEFDYQGNPFTPSLFGGTVNLIENPEGTLLSYVMNTVCFLQSKGSSYHVENLHWSFDAIMNSCDQDLRQLLKANMQKYERKDQVGPILYLHLIDQLTSLSPEAVQVVIQKIVDLKVTSFEGESIPLTCKYARAGLKWLAIVNK